MNREIEKITALKNVVGDNDRKSIDNIVDVFSNTFKQVLINTKNQLLNGEAGKLDMKNVIEAMNSLRKIANKTKNTDKFSFLELNNNNDAMVYVLKFGKELIKGA